MKIILLIIICSVGAVFAASFLGWISGIYRASRESSFRRRAIQLLGTKTGQAEEFLILSGEPALVNELYQVCVATTARVQQVQAAQAAESKNDEGIALDDREDTSTD